MKYNLKDIPPSAIFFVDGQAIFAKVIRWWSCTILKGESKANHCGIYWGSGKSETVEAGGFFVSKQNFRRYLKKRFKIRVYAKEDLTLQQMQILKAFSYGSVGRLYDWARMIKFLFRVTPEGEYQNTCVENVAATYREIGIDLPKDTPSNMEDYLSGEDGQKLGFKMIWSF